MVPPETRKRSTPPVFSILRRFFGGEASRPFDRVLALSFHILWLELELLVERALVGCEFFGGFGGVGGGGVGLGWRILKVFKEGIYDVYVYIYVYI